MGNATYLNLGNKNVSNMIHAGDKFVILGDKQGETVIGSKFNDVIKTAGGSDFIMTNLGVDKVDGGNGSDTISYSDRTLAINVKLDGTHEVKVNVDGVVEDKIKNVENVTGGTAGDKLIGDKLANMLVGYGGADKLKGMAGNDKLYGGAGADTVFGGSGKDSFHFTTALGEVDHIKDFSHADDTIVLENFIFSAFAKVGTIKANKFVANASGHDAHTAKQKLIYDKADHSLWYDADGNGAGAAVQIAVLDNGINNLSYTDFLIV
jgi:serralysin